MASINNVDELKKALINGDNEITISDKKLAKQVSRLKSLSGASLGAIIMSGLWFVVNPLVGIATIAIAGVWLGRDVVEMIVGLGKENTKKLYFQYSKKKDDQSNLVLTKK